MKYIKRLSVLAISSVLALTSFSACDDSNVTTAVVLVYLLDQAGGNCATVIKSSDTLYNVTITSVPKGQCATVLTQAEQLASIKTLYSNLADKYTAAGSSCSTLAAASNSVLATYADNDASRFTDLSSYASSYSATTVSSLVTETATGLKNTTATYTNGVNMTDAQISATSAGSLDAYNGYLALLLSSSTPDCYAAVSAGNTEATNAYNTQMWRTYGGSNSAYAEPAVKVIIANTCQYGSSASDTNKCASLSTEF